MNRSVLLMLKLGKKSQIQEYRYATAIITRHEKLYSNVQKHYWCFVMQYTNK